MLHNDGYPEIVVGCWDEGATYYGHTYCIKGKELTTHWVHSHGVTGLEVRAVTALCVIPDVNGDGFWDVVAGHETVCVGYIDLCALVVRMVKQFGEASLQLPVIQSA